MVLFANPLKTHKGQKNRHFGQNGFQKRTNEMRPEYGSYNWPESFKILENKANIYFPSFAVCTFHSALSCAAFHNF